jgi:cytochrome c-type biogenesis protein CcmH
MSGRDQPAGAAAPAAAAAAAVRPSRGLALSLVLGIVLIAVVGYSFTGSPASVTSNVPTAAATAPGIDADEPVSDEQVAALIDRMAQRLRDKPDDPQGWQLLARAYAATNRFDDAANAYAKALAGGGEDATLLADYADALAARNNGRLDEQAIRMVQRALELEPQHPKALALSGSAAFDAQDYATAVQQWEKVERMLPADSPFRAQVAESIAAARQRAGLLPAPAAAAAPAPSPSPSPAPSPTPAPTAQAAAAANPGAALRGRVTLAESLKGRADPQDTVFVLARAANGPRMPLAVLRRQVKDLPFDFALDDSMAMTPQSKISDHPQVIVVARISKSGNPIAQPGDLAGETAPLAPGASGIAVVIGTEVAAK